VATRPVFAAGDRHDHNHYDEHNCDDQEHLHPARSVDRHGNACDCCCSILNFFATKANAERWFAERPHVRGRAISMDHASAAGRAVFGDVIEK
jgi:hypothetical protein